MNVNNGPVLVSSAMAAGDNSGPYRPSVAQSDRGFPRLGAFIGATIVGCGLELTLLVVLVLLTVGRVGDRRLRVASQNTSAAIYM